MNKSEILNPVRTIRLASGETVAVRELKWGDALGFLRALSQYAALMFGPDGRPNVTAASLGGIIASTDELASLLLTKATGKDSAWIAELDLSQAFDLIEAALSINFEVIKKSGAAIAARIAPAKMTSKTNDHFEEIQAS